MRSLVRMNLLPGTESTRAALLPAEQAHVKQLTEQGVVEAGYLAADRSHAWIVVRAESEERIEQVLSGFPFFPYMTLESTPLLDLPNRG